jgi:hypothetical protein
MCDFHVVTCPGDPGAPPNGRPSHGNGVRIVKECEEANSEQGWNVWTHKNKKELKPPIIEPCDECRDKRPSRQQKSSKFAHHPHPYHRTLK